MDDFETRLGVKLGAAVPEPPLVPERAGAARARAQAARRRRRVGVAAAAAVLVAIALPVALVDRGSPRPGREPAPEPAAELTCPRPAERGETPAPVTGPETIAAGAVAVRLCPPYGGEWALNSGMPADALTTAVARVAAALNTLPGDVEHEMCPADGGPTWDLVFGYPDGHTQIARGSFAGCGGWQVGSDTRGDRSDMHQPLTLFQELLWQQRLAEPIPTYDGPAPDCDRGAAAATPMPLEPELDFRAASLCWRYETESEQPVSGAALTPEQIAVLLADLNVRAERGYGREEDCEPGEPNLELVGVNAWGDVIRVGGWCGVFTLYREDTSYVWRPSEQAQAVLDAVVAAHPTVLPDPTPTTPPDQVVSLWADLMNAGETGRAAALWSPQAPFAAPALAPGERFDVKTQAVSDHVDVADGGHTRWRAVTALYLLRPADGSWVDYTENTFVLGRDSAGESWRIWSMERGAVVPTGR